MITLNEIESYKKYGKVLAISNGIIEAYVTTDLGPRIIRFGFVGGQNFMNDNRDDFGKEAKEGFEEFFGKGKAWENFGGHRIWTSPESYPEVYYPDCTPVKVEKLANGAIFTPDEEIENGMQKSLKVEMSEDGTDMNVTMFVKNTSDKPMEFAIWGLSVSAQNGNLIIPMNTNDTGLLSNRIISVWPYTDLRDDRIYFGGKYATLKQDVNATKPIKLGFDLNGGKVYYVKDGEVFTKSYKTFHETSKYPDGGCSFETYTNDKFIEVESLGELKIVNPGETSEHTENWKATKNNTPVDFKDDDSIENFISKL